MLVRHRRLVCRRNDEPRIVLPTNEWSQPGPQPQQEQETQDEQTGLWKSHNVALVHVIRSSEKRIDTLPR